MSATRCQACRSTTGPRRARRRCSSPRWARPDRASSSAGSAWSARTATSSLLRWGRCRRAGTPATASPGRWRWRCGWRPTTCCGRTAASRCWSSTTCSPSSTSPPRAAGRAGRAGRAGSRHGRGAGGCPRCPGRGTRRGARRGGAAVTEDVQPTRRRRDRRRRSEAAAAPPLPPPSGVDLGRALLAQARADARSTGCAPRTGRPCAPATWTASGAAAPVPTTATRSRSAASVDRLVTERGWAANAAVGGVVARWPVMVGPELADHCVPERLRGHGPDRPRRLDRLGHPAAAARPDARRPAQRRVRRRHRHAGEGARPRPARRRRQGRLRVPGQGPRDTYG